MNKFTAENHRSYTDNYFFIYKYTFYKDIIKKFQTTSYNLILKFIIKIKIFKMFNL